MEEKLTTEQIASHLQGDEFIIPGKLSSYRSWLAAESYFLNQKIISILMVKPEKWLIIRENKKSDTAAEREWQSSKEGIEEMILSRKIKSIDKLMSAIKTRIDILLGESKNQF